jgi:serine/threonine protein kinase
MPDHEDSLGGETFSGEEQQDPAQQSLGDGATMGGDTAAHSLGDQSTFGDANVDDELFDDGMKLEDLSERYTEEGVLGKGGMGEVILATDTRLNRKVAIKRIIGKAARSKTAVARFLTEAQSMAELSHPNIVQIYDYGRATDGPFLIMECIQGGSLLDKCKAGSIEIDEAINIFGQLCDGLAKAHAAGIIHRDIKPANVLMTEDGVPKLTDFGLAKDGAADTGMTMEGAVIGTLDFMPPEQRQAAELTDHRSDLWSLAATFYQMLTGKSPKIIRFSDVPMQLQDPLGKALEESKEDRFQSALELKEAVQQAATVGLNASRDLGEGECPSCGTTNPSDRKFCRNADCAASLEVECLRCKTGMPMWEPVCGSCGTKQDPLLEEIKKTHQARHDEAEIFFNELKFDDALKAASSIGVQNDLRLQQFTTWQEEFSTRVESSRTSEHARLEELLREALAHEQAYDFESGLQTLEQVAPSLRLIPFAGISDTATEINERLTTKHTRRQELETIVRNGITKRALIGLLPIVDELLTLKPDRPEVQKLKAQLEKRDADLLETRNNAVQKATQELDGQQYADAVATLNAVSEEVSDAQIVELKAKASDLLNRLNHLRDRITAAVNVNQLKGILPVVQECLALKADQDDFVKLKEQLQKRDADLVSSRDNAYQKATQQLSEQQYAEALATLNTVSQEVWNDQFIELQTKSNNLFNHLNNLRKKITLAVSAKQLNGLLPVVEEYLTLKADQDYFVKLKQELIIRDAQMLARNPQIIAQAQTHMQQLQFAAAVQLLGTIAQEYQTSATVELSEQAHQLLVQRQGILNAKSSTLSKWRHKTTIKTIRNYLAQIAKADIQDPQLQQMLDEAKDRASASFRKKEVALTLILATCVAAMLITGLVTKINDDAKVLETAISNQDWETVLELDPYNSEGLRMKAAVAENATVLPRLNREASAPPRPNNLPEGTVWKIGTSGGTWISPSGNTYYPDGRYKKMEGAEAYEKAVAEKTDTGPDLLDRDTGTGASTPKPNTSSVEIHMPGKVVNPIYDLIDNVAFPVRVESGAAMSFSSEILQQRYLAPHGTVYWVIHSQRLGFIRYPVSRGGGRVSRITPKFTPTSGPFKAFVVVVEADGEVKYLSSPVDITWNP